MPQCWKNAVAKATSDLYHMEASITVFLHRGRQSAVTWSLRPNRIPVQHCMLSCSTCSLGAGTVLHWRESMLRPGGILQRQSRGSLGTFACISVLVCHYCQSILQYSTPSSLFGSVSATKHITISRLLVLDYIFRVICLFLLFFWDMEEYRVTCHHPAPRTAL